jgi:hypothetical protein
VRHSTTRKKLKLSSDGGDSDSKRCKRGYGGAYGGVWRTLRLTESAFGRSLESGVRFCVGAFGRNLATVAVKMFPHLICIIKKFYKLCTFDAICKDNAAMNCITVQHRKCSFPSTLTGHTKLVLYNFRYTFKIMLKRLQRCMTDVADAAIGLYRKTNQKINISLKFCKLCRKVLMQTTVRVASLDVPGSTSALESQWVSNGRGREPVLLRVALSSTHRRTAFVCWRRSVRLVQATCFIACKPTHRFA